METIIRAEKLGKTFKIYDHPRDRLREALSFSRKKYHTAHRALHDVSFSIKSGEFIGIIGKNGAGKSTLLKLLSGELTPTAGQIDVKGSVALLQLGVGFDPELSGIENARFSGSLMGFEGARLDRMIEDVIEFAEIDDFIHHPVKTYSSGMYSRLAFAIAVNVDPDILIADEVLAVGDIRFSQKCLRKMREFKDRGKTVILVTHDITTIRVFCDRTIWIKDGGIFEVGPSQEVAEDFSNYMLYGRLPTKRKEADSPAISSIQDGFDSMANSIDWITLDKANMIGGEKIRIVKVCVLDDESGRPTAVAKPDTKLRLNVLVEALEDIERPYCGWLLNDTRGLIALHLSTDICNQAMPAMRKGSSLRVCFTFQIPYLNNGEFVFALSAGQNSTVDHRVHDVLPIEVVNPAPPSSQAYGYVLIQDAVCEFISGEQKKSFPNVEAANGI